MIHSPPDLKPGHIQFVTDTSYEFIKFQRPPPHCHDRHLRSEVAFAILGFPLRVLIIPHPDELLVFVAPGRDQHCDA